jgi:V/A-type H+-transporting ATPase subunit A
MAVEAECGRPPEVHTELFPQNIIRPTFSTPPEEFVLPVKGKIEWISGPAVKASGMSSSKMSEVVLVGEEKLIGEVIKLAGDIGFVQVYESTSGLRPGEPVLGTNQPLSTTLGPGMIGTIYDGLQRPLDIIAKKAGSFITRGIAASSIPFDKEWEFAPSVKKGDEVEGGSVLGTVHETPLVEHRILVPPTTPESRVDDVVKGGKYKVDQTVVIAEAKSGKKYNLKLYQTWPVRTPRPIRERLDPVIPLITGQRVLDCFFPMSKGGTGAIPGAFGTGKCVAPGTPVLLADGQLVPVEELYERFAETSPRGQSADEAFLPACGVSVLSFDGKKLRGQQISHVYRGRTDRLVRLRTKSGRTATVTPAHKLILFRPDASFEERATAELKEGDFIALPRRMALDLPIQSIDPYSIDGRIVEPSAISPVKELIRALADQRGSLKRLAQELGVSAPLLSGYLHGPNRPTTSFVKKLYSVAGLERPSISRLKAGTGGKVVAVPKHLDDELAEFLGLLLSDGMIAGKEIRFFNNDVHLLSRFGDLTASLFGLNAKLKRFRTVGGMAVHSTLLIRLLHNLGFPKARKSRNAVVPPSIMKSPDSVVGAFLCGYYLGDGSFSDGIIEISSESKKLVDGLSYLLSRLGVLYSIMRGKREGRRLIVSSVRELRNFLSATGLDVRFDSVVKVSLLREFASKEWSSQTRDLVPIDTNLLRTGFKPKAVENYVKAGERLGISKFEQLMLVRSSADIVGRRLHNLAEALEWVFVDEIESMESVEGEQVVYDVTVPDYHNFVGGHQPMILHNTVSLHSVAKYADAKVVFHIGCGERGNEMTEVLVEFPKLTDPQSGRPLMERTILVANVSNMPVAAREASIYTGVTMAEYYRDMGYDTVLVADSTSRWAEALREISGRLEEMPAEEGYPSYLASRLAEFYERAGRVELIGTRTPPRTGSITLIGAVSPAGGDFTEPVTSQTIRFVKNFWALDARLAYSRHYPAIDWMTSYSGYIESVSKWWGERVDKDWLAVRANAYAILQKEDALKEIVRLLGPEALPDDEKLILDVARMIRVGFLQQNAYEDVDAYCSPQKQFNMMKMFVQFHQEASKSLRNGVPLAKIRGMQVIAPMLRAKFAIRSEEPEKLQGLVKQMFDEFASLGGVQEVETA